MNSDSTREHFRLFVAIRVPDQVKEALAKAQAELRRNVPAPAIRWTTPGQMHLTLRFFGNVDSPRIPALVGSVTTACSSFAPLEITAGKIGFFPHNRVPRVIWAGVRDSTDQLPQLQQAVDVATREFTIEPPETKFVGHLTLGRIKILPKRAAVDLEHAARGFAENRFGHWVTDSVELIRSQLSPHGANYTTLATIPLPAPRAVRQN